ncbi:hemoglobin subunit alpha-like [Carcharodon carcharias]|uniref:hemoglobin subunit alpha-like n=1 Tax=Carcharodon carcharias TaxID=13397 RepID=UPI001B7E5FB3|nr:hemoglobin subunit alpha-like [Carcharodon carcharias]
MPSKQFTAADRTALAEVGKVLSQHAEAFGAESLARLFATHPASKIYFSEFTDYSAAGPRVRVHGAKVLGAVAKAIGHLDDLHTHLEPLAVKHGHVLLVDPHNFPTFATCILVTVACHLGEFSPAAHCALDKLLTIICQELSSQYR